MSRPLAVSCGDPSGIGLEVILKAWQKRLELDLPPFVIFADPQLLRARAAFLGIDIEIHLITTENPVFDFSTTAGVIPLENRQIDALGTPLRQNAAGTIEAIERAVTLVMQGGADAVVTCPIAKKPLYDSGFAYPGHTEFLAALAQNYVSEPVFPVMMLAGRQLRTVPVTVHLALKDVFEQLTCEHIVKVATICAHDMEKRFAIRAPRIALAGLNPHAGENGSMGVEEQQIIQPAIDILKAQGLDIIGPLPADTMFHERARETYDVALCMYHDQALIPVKTLDFDHTVNVTLGLPFIRTSPDHGTAFDIADKNLAVPDSFIEALKMARQLADLDRKYND